MNRIEKIVNTDNSRSHRSGLLPFVRYGGDGTIEQVTAVSQNGNYGHYVCDFIIYEEETVKNELSISYTKTKELNRLKYLDVLRNYSFIQEQLDNSVFVKKHISGDTYYVINTPSKDECISVDETCVEWLNMTKYEYLPLDKNLFKLDTYGYVAKDETIKNQIEQIEAQLKQSGKKYIYAVLIPNYDEVMLINDKWNTWWKDNFKNEDWKWGYDVFNNFDGYSSKPGFEFCEDVDKYILGKVEVVGSGITGSRVPSYVYYSNFYDLKQWFEVNSASTVNAYENKSKENEWIIKEWEERGGGEFYNFLSKIKPKWQTKKTEKVGNKYFTYAPPLFEFEVILNSEEDYETMYAVYEYSVYDNNLEGAVKQYNATESGVGSALTKQWVNCENSSAYCESKLETLKSPNAIMLDKDIFGCFEEFSGGSGQFFECIYVTGMSKEIKNKYVYQVCGVKSEDVKNNQVKYSWWEFIPYKKKDIVCADGEDVASGEHKYRNVTTLSCFPTLVGPSNPGDTYYVLARYDNGVINPENILDENIDKIHSLKIPYVTGTPLNHVSYDDGTLIYDEILELITSSDTITIKYAKGITSGDTKTNSGIHYEEIFRYENGLKKNVLIDGLNYAEIYYDAIIESLNKTLIYNPEYKQYRQVNLAKITGMEVGTQWTEDSAVEAMLITKDGFDGLKDEPRYDINLLYNRGNAAAWENHFKLSECNTLEDLENYGNNFFNI